MKIWCTNDYLNMSHNPDVIDTMISTIKEVGTGSGGTRNISGTTAFHVSLEEKIAQFHKRESAVVLIQLTLQINQLFGQYVRKSMVFMCSPMS